MGCYGIGFVCFCGFGFDWFVVIGFGGFAGRFVGNLVWVVSGGGCIRLMVCFCVWVGEFGCLRIWTGGCFAFWFGCFSAYEYLISWQLVFGCCNMGLDLGL